MIGSTPHRDSDQLPRSRSQPAAIIAATIAFPSSRYAAHWSNGSSTNLCQVMNDAADGLTPPPGVRIVRDLGETTILWVDRWLLAHAVRNLVVNAMDAVGQAGLVVMELKREGPDVVLRVTDDGPGVSDDSIDQIFDPLFTTKPGGTGLGLTIVQRVAEAHGASLEVRNAPGSGASFSIRWPAEAAGP